MQYRFMQRCFELAQKGRGKTGVNPMVGAVLVRENAIIAEGYHEAFGKAHAERQLLEKYEQKIESNDVLYVSLEPCCHTSKKTPPCTSILLERGVKQLVYGMKDPNPEVAGKGIELLNKNGVQTFGPFLQSESRRLNRGFVSLMTKGRPWITSKEATTVDGQVARPDGTFLKITSKEQDQWSHAHLRAKHDAILVGIGTALADNPTLTVRHADTAVQPWRIVIDPALKLPLQAHLVSDENAARTIVVVRKNLEPAGLKKAEMMRSRGVRIMEVSHDENGVNLPELWKALTTPDGDFHGISSVLVEGGKTLRKSFKDASCIDEEVTLVGIPDETEKRTPLY